MGNFVPRLQIYINLRLYIILYWAYLHHFQVIEISKAARHAVEQSAEADRLCNELAAMVDRARDQAASVRIVAESLADTAAAVARMSLESCRYHGYREALESATRAGLLRPESRQLYENIAEIDVTGFLRVLAGGNGDAQTSSSVDGERQCRSGDVAFSPSVGCSGACRGSSDGGDISGNGQKRSQAPAMTRPPTSMQHSTSLPVM